MKYFQQKCEEKYDALSKKGRSVCDGTTPLGKCRLEGAGWMVVPHQAAPNEVFGCCGQAWEAMATQAQTTFAYSDQLISSNGISPQADYAVRFGFFIDDYTRATFR